MKIVFEPFYILQDPDPTKTSDSKQTPTNDSERQACQTWKGRRQLGVDARIKLLYRL